ATPRWSAPGQPALSPASIAGLPGSGAWVGVGPPLSWSGPSWGSVLIRSPAALKPHSFVLSRLCPWEVSVPAQFCTDGAVLFATIVFFTVIAPSPALIPPVPEVAVFPVIVLLSSVTAPVPVTIPAPRNALLPLTVLL